MTKYWAQAPKKTSFGRLKTVLKSCTVRVMPMPNMMTPRRTERTEIPPTLPSTQEKLVGRVMPMMRKMTAMTPKYLPIRAQTFFMMNTSF